MKKNEKMFSILLHLSNNMWGDENSRLRFSHWHPEMDADYEVWRRVIDALPAYGFNSVLIDVGDAVQYESHPEISLPGAWTKDFFKAELDHMRKIGLTPFPKLNFSGGHDAWLKVYSRMLGTDTYRKVAADLMKEVYELFGKPRYFHLGMDEENPTCQRALQFSCTRRNGVLWKDMFHLFHTCETLGSMPWIWSDFYWSHPEEFLYNMPKSVLQCPWNYSSLPTLPSKRYSDLTLESSYDPAVIESGLAENAADKAILDLDKAGFQYTLCCSNYTCRESSERTMEVGRDLCNPELLVGYFTAPWCGTYKNSEFRLMDALHRFKKAKEIYYPELMK